MSFYSPLMPSVALPLQTRLDHRGGIDLADGGTPPRGPLPGEASLFPPPGTFAALGGRQAVARLVDGLYDRIETDRLLRPAFSPDLATERENQKLFFEAWLGGDAAYFDADWRHGLKARHAKISISRGIAERWLRHFLASLADATEDAAVVRAIEPVVAHLAMALVNRADEPATGERLRSSCSIADMRPLTQQIQRDDAAGIAATATAHPELLARPGSDLLLLAAVRGKAHSAEALLRQGVDVNAPAKLPGSDASALGLPQLPITPLCGALARRREAIVKLLIDHGAQYDIFSASCLGDGDAVRELLDRAPALADAPDPACDVARITPLLHAVSAGHLPVAQLLLERGATVGPNSARLIWAAADGGHTALTDLLLEHGADAASIGPGAWVGYSDIAERLVAHGADVNRPPGRWVGLCCTGNSGHKENAALARAFLLRGADVAARYGGRTALHCAARAGFVHVAAALIEYGADVNALCDRGLTPLDAVETAAKSIDREPIRCLLTAHGARRSTL